MRYVFAIASLGLACCSITLSRTHAAADSWVCRAGLCEAERITADALPAALQPAGFVPRLNEDASDPYLWSDYADSLAANGDTDRAAEAFEQAVDLGPNLPPVLIRAAYFAFTRGRFERGAALSNRILKDTSAFDPLVFSYLHYFGQGHSAAALSAGIPASARPARTWASWIAANGSEAEISDTFSWMNQNGLLDRPNALDLTWKLWQRKFFVSSQKLWLSWVGSSNRSDPGRADPPGQLLANQRFESEPDGSPFDWTIPGSASVTISRDHGLAIRFLGAENVELDGIQQSTLVKPGRYHFSAVVESDGLTTDERPFFRIFDPANSNRLNLELPPLPETTSKSEIGCELLVPQGTEALTIGLVRRSSGRFDNKIQGTLHVYQVSLVFLSDSRVPGDAPAVAGQ